MNANKPNLRFLLALGNTKIVVLKDQERLHVYANKQLSRKHAVAAERLADALSAR